MQNANLSLQILPVTDENNIYFIVDEVIKLIESTGLKYVVGPMETTIEGDLDELLSLVKHANDICIKNGVSRVLSVIKIDYKPNGVTIDEKINKYR